MRAFYSLVLGNRGVVLALLTGLTIWLGSYLWPLDEMLVDFSFEGLLVAEGSERDALTALHADFGEDTGVLSVVVELPPAAPDTVVGSPQWLARSVFAPQVVDAMTLLEAWFQSRREIAASAVVGLGSVANLLTPAIEPAYLDGARARLERALAETGFAPQQAVAAVAAGEPVPPAASEAVEAYRRAVLSLLDNGIYTGRLVSPDGSLAVVRAAFTDDAAAPSERAPAIDAARQQLTAIEATLPAGSTLHLVGVPVIQKAYSDIALRDIRTFIPITCALIMLLLWIAFRSTLAVVAPMTGVGMATIWGLGLMQLGGEPLNLVNNVTGVVALVIGVADGVHILTRYYQLAPTFTDKRDAIIETMVQMTPACFVTSLTTAIGFGSLLTAAIPSIRAFGGYVGVTILMAFAAQMLVMPILLSMVKKPDGRRFVAPARSKSGRALLWLADAVGRRTKVIVFATGIGVVAALVGVSQVENDARAMDELAEDHPIPTTLRLVETELTGVLSHAITFSGRAARDSTCLVDDDCAADGDLNTRVCRKTDPSAALIRRLRVPIGELTNAPSGAFWSALESSVRAPSAAGAARPNTDTLLIIDEALPDSVPFGTAEARPSTPPGVCVESVKNPAFIYAIDAFDRWLTEHPAHRAVVSDVSSLADLLRVSRRALDPELTQDAPLPAQIDRAWIHQTLGLLDSASDDTLARQVTRDMTRTHVTIHANDAGTQAWRRLRDAIAPELERRFGSGAGPLAGRFEVAITGSSTLTQNVLSRIVADMTTSLAWAFLWIALVIGVLFRSLRVAVVAMVPNVLPLLVTLALMGLAGVSVRVSTVIIFSVALGIAVDDTIHYLYRYRAELRRGADAVTAAHSTIVHTGRALVLTTAILVVGFTVNLFSEFVAIQQFGLFSAFTFVLAVVADLVVLPAFTRLFLRSRDFL